jgi:hypothetical protein
MFPSTINLAADIPLELGGREIETFQHHPRHRRCV